MIAVGIDYDRLNEASRIVFDVAKAQGEREGGERERRKAAAAHADSALFAAGLFANCALDACREQQQDDVARFALYARRMLGQTPLLMVRPTYVALGLLDSRGVNAERIVSALSAISAAREQLRERYDGLGEIR